MPSSSSVSLNSLSGTSAKPLQDLPYLLFYITHLFLLLSCTIIYGIPSLFRKSSHEISITSTGEEQPLNQSSSSRHQIEISFLFGLLFLLLISSFLSISWVYVTATMANKIVMFSLISMILVNVIGGISLFIYGKLVIGLILFLIAIFSLLFFLYVRTRIEFISANLKVACHALMAMPYIIGWSFFMLLVQVQSCDLLTFHSFLSSSRSSGVWYGP